MTEPISLFFPMFNEEGNIGRSVESALNVLGRTSNDGEVIVVNDGSRDRTGDIADQLARRDPRVRVVHHVTNRGYGAALRSGFDAARHPIVGFVDGDNQFDLAELPRLLAEMSAHDIVSGFRIRRRDPWRRRVNAFVYNMAVRALFDVPIRDVNCGFKLYRREVVRSLLPHLQTTGSLNNVEMLTLAMRAGARVAEVGVHHYPRVAGHQTGSNPAVIARAGRELIMLARRIR